MSTQRNPLNPNTFIDLGLALTELAPQYGRIYDSGLFEEQGILSKTYAYEVEKQENAKMTKLTSFTERDASRVAKAKKKAVIMNDITIKVEGGVHVEDLIGVVDTGFDFKNPNFNELVNRKLLAIGQSWSADREYIVATATQGQVRDPLDGDVVIDQYQITGTTRPTATITASPTADIKGSIASLVNQIIELNGMNGNVGMIEVPVTEEAFNAITSHPDFATIYQLAYQGRGAETLAQPFLNGSVSKPIYNQYGRRREFEWDGVLFTTYPQKFYRMKGGDTTLLTGMKGYTIVHGLSGLYNIKYTPAPYISTAQQVGQKVYARSTGIVKDTHMDMSVESHMIPFMTRPEMSIDVTVTTA